MDSIDRKILAELQRDGRLSNTDLAERVGLTPAPCHRRVRELERTAVITGYRADVDPAALGMNFSALVQITMDRGDADTVARFEAAVADVPEIQTAERLFGEPDYILRVLAPDLDGFADLRDTKLATLPGVARLTSTIVMRRVVQNSPVPTARGREPNPGARPNRA